MKAHFLTSPSSVDLLPCRGGGRNTAPLCEAVRSNSVGCLEHHMILQNVAKDWRPGIELPTKMSFCQGLRAGLSRRHVGSDNKRFVKGSV